MTRDRKPPDIVETQDLQVKSRWWPSKILNQDLFLKWDIEANLFLKWDFDCFLGILRYLRLNGKNLNTRASVRLDQAHKMYKNWAGLPITH